MPLIIGYKRERELHLFRRSDRRADGARHRHDQSHRAARRVARRALPMQSACRCSRRRRSMRRSARSTASLTQPDFAPRSMAASMSSVRFTHPQPNMAPSSARSPGPRGYRPRSGGALLSSRDGADDDRRSGCRTGRPSVPTEIKRKPGLRERPAMDRRGRNGRPAGAVEWAAKFQASPTVSEMVGITSRPGAPKKPRRGGPCGPPRRSFLQ
jgi:hypothetical protein